uniref:Uncharacterized protein n=1 Tax=viral metagenome TaxID=1070528 RepID=A0A6C0JUT6_9ZZZZ
MSSPPTPSQPSMPGQQCLQHCCKIAISDDKPILLDYWNDSLDGKVMIGVKDNDEKLLVKSSDEYTSPILKIYRVDTEYIVMTENSIYVVCDKISTRRIS